MSQLEQSVAFYLEVLLVEYKHIEERAGLGNLCHNMPVPNKCKYLLLL